jgi:hypothetical protein
LAIPLLTQNISIIRLKCDQEQQEDEQEKNDIQEEQDKVMDQSDLSGSTPGAARISSYRCDICSGTGLNRNNAKFVIRAFNGDFNCQGLYRAALNGGVIP